MPGAAGKSDQTAQQPALIVCTACVAGVVIDRWLAPGLFVWMASIATALSFWAVAFRRRAISWGAVAILLALLSTSALWHHARWRLYPATEIGRYDSERPRAVCVEGWTYTTPRFQPAPPRDVLSTVPAVAESRWVLIVERVRNCDQWQPASGVVAVSVKGRLANVACGDRLRIFGVLSAAPEPLNPGERSVREFERAERRLCRLHVSEMESVQVLQRRARWRLAFLVNGMRNRFDGYLRHYVQGSRAGLSCAILLGTREDVDRQRNEAFMTTGTIHLLAISGLNVAILAYAFWIAGRLGLIRRAITLLGGIAFVVWYAMLADAQPPVIRAAVLVTVMCLARLCGRQSLNFNTLAVAGIVVLAINPASLFLVGTQLSFLAVATMACIPTLVPGNEAEHDPLRQLIRDSRSWPDRMWRRFAAAIWQSMILSTVIWLISLPLVMYRFHVVSPIAIVLNPIVCLPMAVALFAGFGVMIFGSFAPPMAAICGWLCDESLWLMEYSIDQALKIPGNHFWGPAPPAWWVAIFYLGLVLHWSYIPRCPRRWAWAIVLAWCALGTWLTFGPGARSFSRDHDCLECTFIAVGHGTSALIEFPDGKTLLYDAGKLGYSYSGGQTISSVLWSRGINHLDALVISHADADHFNAVPYLLERFSVGVIYVSPTMFRGEQSAVRELQATLQNQQQRTTSLARGDSLHADAWTKLQIHHPPHGGIASSDNANSIVLLVEFAGRRLLLPGDLETPGMEELLTQTPLDCDALMAPHHGSMRSNPAGFLAWSTPEIVVISGSGKRDTTELVSAYERAGAQVFHTAFDGAVQITMTSNGVEATTFRYSK